MTRPGSPGGQFIQNEFRKHFEGSNSNARAVMIELSAVVSRTK
jgi:hypothetical protein